MRGGGILPQISQVSGFKLTYFRNPCDASCHVSSFPFQDGISWAEVGFHASEEEGPLHSHSFKSPSPSPFVRFGMAGDGTGGVVWTPQCAELMGKTAA